MDEQDEVPIEDMSDVEREWLRLCRELFSGPDRMVEIVRTPPGEERDDLYDVVREAQAILS